MINKERTYLDSYFRSLGLTKKEVAARLGVQPSYITSLCKGHVCLGRDAAKRISDEFGVDFNWVISGEGTPNLSQSISNVHSEVNGNQTISVGAGDAKDELIAELRKQIASLEKDKEFLQSLLTSKLL